MKKILFYLVPFLCVSQIALGMNVLDLQINKADLSQYKVKAEAYTFTDSQLRFNGDYWQKISQMETRGQSSIAAKRRNFGIKLKSEIRLNNIHTKNFNLLNMWIDKGYISSKLGLMTTAHLNIGLPLHTEYTELRINGKTNGLYLLVEKPKSVAKNSPYIVRRAYKSRFKTDKAKPDKTVTTAERKKIEVALASIYSSLKKESGPELYLELTQKMDIESYMKWMIMNSLFKNGDGPDEIFFYVDEEYYKQGQIYFRIMPWDFDDLFKRMHQVSKNEKEILKDPNSILYNFEDQLDFKFSTDKYLYKQLQILTQSLLINELSQPQTDALLNQIQNEISPYLEHTDILNMGALDAGRKSKAYTKKEILDTIAQRKIEIEKRRVWLLQRTN